MSTVLTVVSAVCAGPVALNRGRQDRAGFFLTRQAYFLLALLNAGGDFLAHLGFEPFEEKYLGLGASQIGNLLKFLHLPLDQRFELPAAFFDLFLPLSQFPLGMLQGPLFLELHLVLLIDDVFAFFQATFLFAELGAGLLVFAVQFFALAEQLVLGF